MEQADFEFDAPTRKTMPSPITVVLTWWEGRIIREFPELDINAATFSTWPEALDAVVGDGVRLVVRG